MRCKNFLFPTQQHKRYFSILFSDFQRWLLCINSFALIFSLCFLYLRTQNGGPVKLRGKTFRILISYDFRALFGKHLEAVYICKVLCCGRVCRYSGHIYWMVKPYHSSDISLFPTIDSSSFLILIVAREHWLLLQVRWWNHRSPFGSTEPVSSSHL